MRRNHPAVSFGIYLFAFLLTEFTINVRAEILFGAENVGAVYALGIFCTGLGYLLYPLARANIYRQASALLLPRLRPRL